MDLKFIDGKLAATRTVNCYGRHDFIKVAHKSAEQFVNRACVKEVRRSIRPGTEDSDNANAGNDNDNAGNDNDNNRVIMEQLHLDTSKTAEDFRGKVIGIDFSIPGPRGIASELGHM